MKKVLYPHTWKVNEIAQDFTLWDIWEFPITADNSDRENFPVFEEVYWKGIRNLMTSRTFAGFLFSLRNVLSYVFPFDKNVDVLPIPGCREISVKERLNSEDLRKSMDTALFKERYPEIIFSPVYFFENESLYEFSNNTVHGLLHLGWFKKDKKYYPPTITVYIKPRGIFGRSYLKMIEPFRHHIVYPTMLNIIKREWLEYVSVKNKQPEK
ncbi:MAG: DUF2867 domain-containing protein [Spirochaetes bacterium]|nr:DUF2867 domain-containing protein [Spirochaetota bacterium]